MEEHLWENGSNEKTTDCSWENLWRQRLEEIPCAAYVVQNDGELTLLAANNQFYTLLDCPEQEMRQKYANCFSALLDGESSKELGQQMQNWKPGNAPLALKQKVLCRGKPIFWHTQVVGRCDENQKVTAFYCTSFDIDQYEKEGRSARENQAILQMIAQQARLDYFEYDSATGAMHCAGTSGLLPADLMGENGCRQHLLQALCQRQMIEQQHADLLCENFDTAMKQGKKTFCEVPLRLEDGKQGWVRVTFVPRGAAAKRSILGILEDISNQWESTRNYLNETQFYQAMLSEKDAYAQVDVTEDRITRIGGMWNLYNEVIDKVTYSQLINEFINKVVHPEDRKHYLELMQCQNYKDSLHNGIDRLGCEFRRIVEQNKMMWMQLSVHLFRDSLTHHVMALLYIKNIDAKKRKEIVKIHESALDRLTKTYQKKAAETAIEEYLRQASPAECCAFMILDLDNFHQMNREYGYEAGDQALVRMAQILMQTFRKNDIIGRFGGDEFIVFLKDVQSPPQVAERLEAFYGQLRQTEDEKTFTCSVGVVLGKGGDSYGQIFRRADRALYAAKQAGKNRFVFQEEDQPDAVELPVDAEHKLVQTESLPQAVGIDLTGSQEFDGFVSEVGDIAYLVDPDTFALICGNQAFYNRLGVTPEQMANMKCYEAMHRRSTPCPFCSKANWTSDKFYIWKNLNTALEQEFLIKNKLVQWQGREVLLALAVDISNDKSIVDSMENESNGIYNILSGVQRMSECPGLQSAMISGLETIGTFFQADGVRMWRRKGEQEPYECVYQWMRAGKKSTDRDGCQEMNAWLNHRRLEQQLVLENPESILGDSYEMYQWMKTHKVRNQRWAPLVENAEEMGLISIDNISSNYQNVAFLESFMVFIASELKKRTLIEKAIYGDKHDDLTGLENRNSFEDYLQGYKPDLAMSIGVIVANFNNLKGINSNYGFQVGNRYICQFADMLRQIFGREEVYRLNGDEFLVIVADMGRGEFEGCIAQLEDLVEQNAMFTVSMGHAWDDEEKDLAVLMDQAFSAMRLDKRRHYDSSVVMVDTERRKMLSDLVTSLENREFEVFLQPKVELENNRVVGAEALIRYRHPEFGIIPPAKFIDTLEKNSLIRYVDLFVFEEVCRTLERWKQNGWMLPVISLNFSRLTLLEKDILTTMETIISRYDVERKLIEVEITESAANMGKSVLYQAARTLYDAGFAISLDDFGTKYTNLSILANIDFSILKLDRSLVASLSNQSNYQLIMKNIIAMCKDLGIHVVAEGVETPGQEAVLRELNCQMGQGYLYGRPMPIEEFEEKYLKNGPQ